MCEHALLSDGLSDWLCSALAGRPSNLPATAAVTCVPETQIVNLYVLCTNCTGSPLFGSTS